LKRGPGKYKNRNFEQSRKFWIGLGWEPKVEQKDAQNETRERFDNKNGRDGANLVVDYFISSLGRRTAPLMRNF